MTRAVPLALWMIGLTAVLAGPVEAAGKKPSTKDVAAMCKIALSVCEATCDGTVKGLDDYMKCHAACGANYTQCTGGSAAFGGSAGGNRQSHQGAMQN